MNNQQIDQDAYNAALGTYNAAITAAYNTFVKSVSGLFVPLPVVPVVPTNPGGKTSAPISLSGQSNQTISGLSIIGGTAPCISLTNCNGIHITMCKLYNSTNVGILLTNCSNITIDYNFITKVSTGVYAVTCTNNIIVDNNQMLNMQGPLPRGQHVQLNTCSGTGIAITNNKLQNVLGSSIPEDAISLYMSKGTAASPIKVAGNQILGGGPSKSGGGICVGDSSGDFQYVANNILVDPGQYGIGITGGNGHTVINNQVYAKQQSFTNVGIDIYSQKGDAPAIVLVTNATVSNNQVNFTNAAGVKNPNWISAADTNPAGWSTNNWAAPIDASIIKMPLITYQ